VNPAGSRQKDVAARKRRNLRWLIGLGLTAMVAVGLVLLFLLTQATTNRDLYERNYAGLFLVNVWLPACCWR
jgi:hypothetical protein